MRFNKDMDYVHWSKYFFIFSIVLTVLGVVFLGFLGLNYSVDFRAGSNVDVSLSKNLTQAELPAGIRRSGD